MNYFKSKTLKMLLVFGVLSIILSGCMNNEYKEFRGNFDNTYFEIAKSVNIADTLETLKNIQSEENKNKIEELRVLLENIRNNVSEDKKDEYQRYNNWYKGLVLLRDIPYSEWDRLSFEQKRNVWTEIGLIDIRRD